MAASATSILARLSRQPFSFHRNTLDRGDFYAALWPFSLSADRLFDEFNGDTLQTALWATAVTAGGAPTAFAQLVNSAEGSQLEGRTGTTDDGVTALVGARHWLGDRNCMLECRFILDTVSGMALEIGFVDTKTDNALKAVSDLDVPTVANGAVDTAVVTMDTDQTLTTMAFVSEGSTASMVPTKTDLGTRVPTAATWMTIRVGIVGDNPFCHVYNSDDPQQLVLLEEAYHGASIASQIEGGVVLAPHILFQTRNTTDKIVQLDYVLCLQER